jgi:hypothetical protein
MFKYTSEEWNRIQLLVARRKLLQGGKVSHTYMMNRSDLNIRLDNLTFQ